MLADEPADLSAQLSNLGDAPPTPVPAPAAAPFPLDETQGGIPIPFDDAGLETDLGVDPTSPTTSPAQATSADDLAISPPEPVPSNATPVALDSLAPTLDVDVVTTAASSQVVSPLPPQSSLTTISAVAVVVDYPALPELGSRLSCIVYSHKSVYGSNPHLRGYNYVCEPRDNERLAFVGAAALQLFVGDHLYKKHPLKSVGYLAQLRCFLTSKEMLAHWARQYAMPPLLLAQEASLPILRASTNILSAIFEAYVGAIIQHPDYGLDTANRFVCALIDAQLSVQAEGEDDLVALRMAIGRELEKAAAKEMEGTVGVGRPASRPVTPPQMSPTKAPGGAAEVPTEKNKLAILNERASQLGKLIAWTEQAVGPEHSKSWKMVVSVDGTAVAEGLGDRKQTAKMAAAERAWEALGWE